MANLSQRLILPETHIAEIRAIRHRLVVAGETNSKGGPSCGVTSEEVAVLLSDKGFSVCHWLGSFYGNDGELIDEDHCWVTVSDGSIIDPTIDQFSGEVGPWPGYIDIAVIPPGHAFARHYEKVPVTECRPPYALAHPGERDR